MEKLTLLVVALFVLFALALSYMTPTAIALRRRHPRHVDIRKLNLFLGWTIIGWCAALVWSLSVSDPAETEEPIVIRSGEPHLRILPRAMNEVWTEIKVTSQSASLVRNLTPGDALRLVCTGTAGAYTVKVCLRDGRPIGTLAPDLAARVAMNLDGNRPVDCRVVHVARGSGSIVQLEAVLAFHVLRSLSGPKTANTGAAVRATASG